MAAPITEEDKPFIESMIKRLKRMRKREHAVSSISAKYGTPNLDEAISELMEYGALKGWWEYDK